MKLEIRIHAGSKTSDHQFEYSMARLDASPQTRPVNRLRFSSGGKTRWADDEEVSPGIYSILVGRRSYEVHVGRKPGDAEGCPYLVTVGLRQYEMEIRDPRRWTPGGWGPKGKGPLEIVAPMPGNIVRVLVSENQQVARNQELLVIEAMKMQNEIRAPRAGRVERIYAKEATAVEAGFRLLRLI